MIHDDCEYDQGYGYGYAVIGTQVLPVILIEDKDGNQTDNITEATTIIAGTREIGWFEIDIVEGYSEFISFH